MINPKVNIVKNKIDSRIEIFTILIIALTFLLILFYYNQLPDKLPIYFNWPTQDKTGLGDKSLLFILPTISALTFVGLNRLIKTSCIFNNYSEINKDDAELNYRMSTQMLRVLALLISITCFFISISSILNGLGSSVDFNRYIYPTFPIILTLFPFLYLVKMFRHKVGKNKNS